MSTSVIDLPDQIAPPGQPLAQPVEAAEEPGVRALVRVLSARETTLVDAVVDIGVDEPGHLVDLVPERLRIQVRRAGPVVGSPLGVEVEGDLREVVGDQLPACDLDHRRHGDPAGVVRKACEVGLLHPRIPEHRIHAVRVEIEGPAPLVVSRPAQSHRDRRLQTEQPSDDDRPARPRTRPRGDQPVPAGLDRVAVPAVAGDPGRDVFGVALVVAAGCDVTATGHDRQPMALPVTRGVSALDASCSPST